MYVKEQYIIVLHVHDVIVKKLAGPFILTKKKNNNYYLFVRASYLA